MGRISGYDSVNRNVLSRVQKVARNGADVTSGGRQFHTWGPVTENARLSTVERWTGGWTRQSLQKRDRRRHRRQGDRSITGPSFGPPYGGPLITMMYLEGLNVGRGNFGGVWHVEGSSAVGMWPSVKKSAASMWSRVGRPVGSSVRRQLMRSRADMDTYGGSVYLLFTIRMYVSLSVVVSNGGRPHSSAYLNRTHHHSQSSSLTKSSRHYLLFCTKPKSESRQLAEQLLSITT